MKFSGKVWSDHGTTWLNFGSSQYHSLGGSRCLLCLAPPYLTLPYLRGGCQDTPALRPQFGPNAQPRQTSWSKKSRRGFGIPLENCPVDTIKSVQCRVANFQKMKFGTRRRDRDAVGVEGVGNGEGVPPPQPTRGSGGASWGPPAGSGAEPRPKTNLELQLQLQSYTLQRIVLRGIIVLRGAY